MLAELVEALRYRRLYVGAIERNGKLYKKYVKVRRFKPGALRRLALLLILGVALFGLRRPAARLLETLSSGSPSRLSRK